MFTARYKRRGLRLRATAALLALAASSALSPALSAESLSWAVYGGRWGLEKEGTASELGVEFQRPLRYDGFDLIGGLAATDDEAFWAYLGASWSWQGESNWRLRPAFAVSLFDEGDGKDLGGPVEFRSSIEATYQLPSKLRLGLMLYHLSNAGFYDLNPGSNSLVFVVGFP